VPKLANDYCPLGIGDGCPLGIAPLKMTQTNNLGFRWDLNINIDWLSMTTIKIKGGWLNR
jgi:hypothetical protein